MKSFGGTVLFLDRSDINTDEIIPARYLTEVEKTALQAHLLEDLKLEGFDPQSEAVKTAQVLVTRENFGCGSSREHAPWALEVNDITVVIAQSFARIFRQNMFNCGMVAIELPGEQIDTLFSMKENRPVHCEIDLDSKTLMVTNSTANRERFEFPLLPFDEELVRAGGWVELADRLY
jgi:3-isopropylmalate/(R)-2-methylmalate dehydratase small subunit